MLRNARTVARKELAGFFASPAAFLFLGAFLAVTLFVFFWVDTFFARNLADVRPLFQWMPVLLIFLVAALTMRAWAEERRAGTVELLLTAPVSPTDLVLGKFLGAMALVAIALALTLPLPLTVSVLGPLDWGPVVGGYVAALALAAAYVAIGLWVSSRTDNQIVSLIVTVLVAGAFFLIGAPALTDLAGQRVGDLLRALGAGSRFDSITRGVLDLRDLYYYLSITVAFLVLNRLAVEKMRWAHNSPRPAHRAWQWIAALLVANVLGANLWLDQIGGVRADLTADHRYTLSEATRGYLKDLREPLLIRGYFSAATHPLLAPLVPQLRDLLEEYAAAGGDKVRVEFVDPHDDPKLEEEAASRYDIRPVPFQVSSKYKASVVNSYFDVLVSYGDQYKVLGFRDLIDVKMRSEGDFKVALKNPEYDITRAIRKVLLSYQGGGSPFATLSRPLHFTGHLSPDAALPPELATARKALDQALAKLRKQAGDKLTVSFDDPGADPALARKLGDELGFRPLVTGLLDPKPFWFHLTLSDGHQTEPLPLPDTLKPEAFERTLEAAVKRFSPGFLKTVAVYTPPPPPPQTMGAHGPGFRTLRAAMGQSVRWLDTTLDHGQVPAEADMLMVLDPRHLDEAQRFAIDQFLMQGGSVVVATSPTEVELGRSIDGHPVDSGLEDWLAGYGLHLGKGLVLDPQSGALPVPVERPIGNGMSVREIQLAAYPYIVDVRGRGLDADSPVTASLGDIQVPWAAPIRIDAAKNQDRKLTTLLSSSAGSWVSTQPNLIPDYQAHPELGFAPTGARGAHPLAVMLEGRFDSAFKGQPSPLLKAAADAKPDAKAGTDAKTPAPPTPIGRVIDHSPRSARLILIGSSALFSDRATEFIGQALGSANLKPAQFAQNLVDWSLEDQGLLAIRSRGQFARTLAPLPRDAQAMWEYANYGFALGGLALVWLLNNRRRHGAARRHARLLQEV
ncbi:ABC transporter permease subunit [Nitrogeniibacter mangrovi]|uniref:ABC transporter permease subunit n=1 Tax=Nitrogeniibacter mangrovi TaxID=2016596 RepID=A0A6C1B271_9RHOO|nr:Gldg family protein [Nitrogeniibacter mangrovi]QID16928.1 ABC transporter permease subunit [Nitrogeniibacter mangrovi]